jgi:hypothetical protein
MNCSVVLSSPISEEAKTREAKIIRRGKDWYVYITIQKDAI